MTRPAALLRDFARDEEGLALIEFAFVAPILLTLILGGLELANYAIVHMKVNQIAMTVADNAGRVPTGIDEANIHEVFAGAGVMGKGLDFQTHGRVVLSSVQDNGKTDSNRGQMINWQRCWGNLAVDPMYGEQGDGKTSDSMKDGVGAEGRKIMAARDSAVMLVEVSYTYQPLIDTGYMIIDGNIRHESAFNVRGRTNNDITNAQDLQVMDCDD